VNLEQCLDRFSDDYDLNGQPTGPLIWCQRRHNHRGFHRGVADGEIVQWDHLGYLMMRTPAPPDLEVS